jgi:hypothetical protein
MLKSLGACLHAGRPPYLDHPNTTRDTSVAGLALLASKSGRRPSVGDRKTSTKRKARPRHLPNQS